jgi:hypothetical protein
MNLFKSEVAFIGEDARITKSVRLVKSAKKPDPVSDAKRWVLLL